jgi:outer membrane immunogenic protein
MKKHVLSFLAATALTAVGVSAASAADLPSRRLAPAPAPIIAAVPVFTWTGFYVGVNAGYAWNSSNNDNNGFGSAFVPAGTFPGVFAATSGTLSGLAVSNRRSTDGFAGGGQVGYNWQFGSWVIGAETDIQGVAGNHNNNNAVFAAAPTFATATGPGLPPGVVVAPGGGLRGLDWFGTARVRAGVAFDRALIYATGGFAYGGGGGNNNGFGFDNNGSSTRTGWTVGGGVEYAFTNNLTAKVEGLYVNLGSGNRNNAGVFYNAASNAIFVGNGGHRSNDFGVVRAGLNYKFNTF